MKLFIYLFSLVFVLINTGFSQELKKEKEKSVEFIYNCSTCHICEKPTKRNPCLRECPRAELITIHHDPSEGPDRIVMDEFISSSDIYVPVVFTHRVHAEMSGMAGGCALCHHNNPPGHILPCRDCHEMDRLRSDISKPDLMASYHRQCMDCHREWSHTTSCTSCHALKSSEEQTTSLVDATESATRIHPEIVEPTRLLYQTDYEEGKVVTFYHNEHVQLYGLECIDCHQRESCVKCHDKRKSESAAEVSHDRCSDCHDTEMEDKCNSCHLDKAQPPFNHFKRTRFAIDGFHKNLTCKTCHGRKLKVLKLNTACNSCHQTWSSETFDHKKTGFILDEDHIENECEDCHKKRKFNENPNCEDCHEDEFSYPKDKPGKKIF